MAVIFNPQPNLTPFGNSYIRLDGTSDNDVVIANMKEHVMDAGNGDDVVIGGTDTDIIRGEAGNDVIFGDHRPKGVGAFSSGLSEIASATTTSDRIGKVHEHFNIAQTYKDGLGMVKLGGDDTIFGGEGDDYISAGPGADTVYGGPDDDKIHGNDGRDTLEGGPGSDTLWGDEGNDSLKGGAGNDYLYGGAGNDSLYGGSHEADPDVGEDEMFGHDGDDLLFPNSTGDYVEGNDGEDRLLAYNVRQVEGSAVKTVDLLGGNDSDIYEGSPDRNVGVVMYEYDEETGNDLFIGGASSDYAKGSKGDDTMILSEGFDIFSGEDGHDNVVIPQAILDNLQSNINVTLDNNGLAIMSWVNSDGLANNLRTDAEEINLTDASGAEISLNPTDILAAGGSLEISSDGNVNQR